MKPANHDTNATLEYYKAEYVRLKHKLDSETESMLKTAKILAMPKGVREAYHNGLIGRHKQKVCEIAIRSQGYSKRKARRIVNAPKAQRELYALTISTGHRLEGDEIVFRHHTRYQTDLTDSPAGIAIKRFNS